MMIAVVVMMAVLLRMAVLVMMVVVGMVVVMMVVVMMNVLVMMVVLVMMAVYLHVAVTTGLMGWMLHAWRGVDAQMGWLLGLFQVVLLIHHCRLLHGFL